MPQHASLHGQYVRINEAILKEKANRTEDPRHIFYRAILDSDTYEEYFRRVGGLRVAPVTYRSRPVSARMEIVYARTKMGWIADDRR